MRPTPENKPLSLDLKILQKSFLHFSEIDSTNRFLLENSALPHGTIVLADYQSAGRGRFDRVWQSPKDDALLFSVLLKSFPRSKVVSVYPLVAALAVVRGLRGTLSDNMKITVKWPNDVLLNRKKVCGILVQGKIIDAVYQYIVIGIGVNVNQDANFFRSNLPAATSTYNETGVKIDRRILFEQIVTALDDMLILLQESGEKSIITLWEEACDSVGKTIAVNDGERNHQGIFRGLARDGAMRLKTEQDTRKFYAGDVTILKEYSDATGY